MKVTLMTGSHPRHLYVARKLHEAGMLHSLVVERREPMVPVPDPSLSELDRANVIRHFREREEAEIRVFGQGDLFFFQGKLPVLVIEPSELNGEETKRWLREHPADVVITYGVHKLEDDLLALLPEHAWNIHGGLSPWFRGTATLFWPFYFLKPNWAGMTIHRLSSKLDGGDIIHHSVPELQRGDGIHDVACRAVQQVADDLVVILGMLKSGRTITAVPQKSSGKLFTNADWMPQHLRLIYNTFNNDIVDRFLDGEFGRSEPNLVRAF